MQLNVWVSSEDQSRKFKFHYNLTTITDTLHEDLCTFIISRSILLIVRNVSDKTKTHFVLNNFFPKNRAVYEIMWKKM